MSYNSKLTPYGSSQFETTFDLYRINNGLHLDNETHNRFIATKVPVRKNKDYRARLRNYVVGFPVSSIIFIIGCRSIKKITI